MKKRLLRKDGKGLAGTYENANCHAKQCIPFIDALVTLAPVFGFAEWVQGHNVHLFNTTDGRQFDFVPYADETGYCGIEFRRRESRTKAVPIMAVTSLEEIAMFLNVIQAVARPHPANKASRFRHKQE